jgi:hypothetical protein
LLQALKTSFMNDAFVIEWLKTYFNNPQLEEGFLEPVLHFSLIWNLFEHSYFEDDARLTPPRLLGLCDNLHIALVDQNLDRTFLFFKNRYFLNQVLDARFITLGLDTNLINEQPSYFDFCQATLTGQNPTKLDKTKCLFLIIHRFRNNLFHGRKNPRTLNIYEEAFEEINRFLTHFIEYTT